MLDRESNPTATFEFVILVEADEARIDPSRIEQKLSDSLAWVEGVGNVAIGYKGAMPAMDRRPCGCMVDMDPGDCCGFEKGYGLV